MAVAVASTEVAVASTEVAVASTEVVAEEDWAVDDADEESVVAVADEESVASTAVVADESVQCVKNLVCDTVFDMNDLDDYAGAACPICFDDLGSHVPKGYSWATVLHSEANNRVVAAYITRVSFCVKSHVKSAHKHIPLWNMYEKREVSAKHGRGRSAAKEAYLTTGHFLLLWVYKKAVTSIPFDDLCVSTEAVDPSAVIELFFMRFGGARGLLNDPRGTSTWFSTHETPKKERPALIQCALAVLSDHMDTFRETFDPQQQTELCKLTHDQVRNTVNNYFLWENGQELSKPYFSG